MNRVHAPRAVDLAADQIRDDILSGALAPGDHLPPERALAERLGISRLTLRAALSGLEAEGLVRARQGSGVTVLDYRTEGGVALLPHLLARGDLSLLAPLLQLRRAIAVEAVATAIERATEADLDALQALADALATESDPERLAEGNLAFGRAVIRLSDNLPLELLFNTVARVYRQDAAATRALLADPDTVRASFGAIVALIRARDADRARDLVRRALEAIDADTLRRLESP